MSDAATTIDATQTEILLRAYFLGDFLSHCIVEDGYKPPVTIAPPALSLTAKGSRLAGQIKGDGIDLREAQLAVFMNPWAGDELLIDLDQIDLGVMQFAISSEVRRKKIRLPWTYGRQLYDLIADSPFHGSRTPTHDETMGLLEHAAQGVFQAGPYISGPYGLIEGRQWRMIAPTRRVPGYHCSEIDCNRLHDVVLATGESKVAKANERLREKTAKLHAINKAVRNAVDDLVSQRIRPLHWRSNTTLPRFLGDCLTLANLRALVVQLLNAKGGTLRQECAITIDAEIKRAEDFVDTIGDAELMQICLLATDDDIHQALNTMIWDGTIVIPRGEMRRSKLARGAGYMNLRLEASSLGARHQPDSEFMFVRLQAIIDKAFPEGDRAAEQRLLWLLRSYDGETASAKLHAAVADGEPRELIERLLVADQGACAAALQELGLPLDHFRTASDDAISQVLTWHLGFKQHDDEDESAIVTEAVTTLRRIVQGAPALYLERTDERRIREVAGSLFPGLEKLLKRALGFTVWALLRDHYKMSYEMQYSLGAAEANLDSWLTSKPGLPAFSDDTTLGEILTCYGSLSKELSQLESRSSAYQRPLSEYPRVVRDESSTFRFPFCSTVPFLDLSATSRNGIQQAIKSVSAKLSGARATEVRNGLLHDKKEMPTAQEIDEACAAIQTVVSELASYGLLPTVFTLSKTDGDAYGRRRFTFTSHCDSEVVLVRPSIFHLAGFPRVREPQIIVPGARLQVSGEPLRFQLRHDSEFEAMWKDFPRRALDNPRTSAMIEAV